MSSLKIWPVVMLGEFSEGKEKMNDLAEKLNIRLKTF